VASRRRTGKGAGELDKRGRGNYPGFFQRLSNKFAASGHTQVCCVCRSVVGVLRCNHRPPGTGHLVASLGARRLVADRRALSSRAFGPAWSGFQPAVFSFRLAGRTPRCPADCCRKMRGGARSGLNFRPPTGRGVHLGENQLQHSARARSARWLRIRNGGAASRKSIQRGSRGL
jgi:hypothetical protein